MKPCAFLVGNVTLSSGRSTHIDADSTTVIDAAAGSSGVNLDGDGFGASVAVVVDIDDTEAFVGEDAKVTALGNRTAIAVRNGNFDGDGKQGTESVRGLAVTATSFEDELLVGLGAAGAFGDEAIGVGLSVTVGVLKGNTKAYIGDGASINDVNTGANSSQDVLLRAADRTGLLSVAGGVAISEATGIGGAVTVSIVENHVSAEALGNNIINAKDDVTLDADSHSEIDAVAISVAGVVASDDFGFAFAGSGSGNKI